MVDVTPRFKQPPPEPEPVAYSSLSNKMTARRRAREKRIRELKERLPDVCAMPHGHHVAGCSGRGEEFQHIRPRSLTVEDEGVRLSTACHQWVTAHPVEATDLGVSDIRPRFNPRKP